MTCKKCGMPEILLSTPQYQYLESGLENIYISPAKIIACERCLIKQLQINDLELLNFTITNSILLKPFSLTSADLRFLRQYLGYSISDLAEFFRLEVEIIFAIENNQEPISPQFDLLIRFFYVKSLEESFSKIVATNLIEQFSQIDFGNQDNSIVLINLETLPEYYYLQSS